MTTIILLSMLLLISMCCEVAHASGTTFPIVLIICGLVVWGISMAKKDFTKDR